VIDAFANFILTISPV